MSWKVDGAFFHHDYYKPIHGPLPHKRWVRDIPHKRHKIKHRVSNGSKATDTAAEYNERRAIAYVDWLMARDGLKQPSGTARRVEWSGVYVDGKWQRRIQGVSFGHNERVYNTRKDGRQGAYLGESFVTEMRVAIPNWDWVPQVVKETTEQTPGLLEAA